MKANETGALLHAPISKSATPHYQHTTVAQACLPRWQREAARLFAEFWRTGNQKHLRVFFTHVVAMRIHAGGHTQ
jgi:hypothetical protein